MDHDSAEALTQQVSREVRYEFTPALIGVLNHLNASLMVTTYQAGKLLVLGVSHEQLKITFSNYEQPMGLAVSGDRLAIGTRRQINFLTGNRAVASSVTPAGTWDVCYVPRTSAWTGSIHGHDLAWGTEGLWAVNTRFSCLCTLHEDYSFVPRWKPRFISQLIDQDRCHLNGLAMQNGRPRFVTAMAETDTAAGWRPNKASSGVVIDVDSGETIARGFAMPHSPRWYQGKLWVLDSGRGALGFVDPATGRFQTVETFPGYTRGLSFLGQFAFVGLSRIRETSVFGGVPIAERRNELKCGVGVVDLLTGRTVAVFQFLSGVTEIFAVEVAAAAACPYVAGASSDGNEHDVWIVPSPGMVPQTVARKPWFAGPENHGIGESNTAGEIAASDQASSGAAADPSTPETKLEGWLASHPADASAWVTLGNLRQEQNRQPEALECYERAVTADPGMAAPRQNLGYLLFNLGYPERSREACRELLNLDPSPMNQLLSASILPVVYPSCEDLQQWRNDQLAALRKMVDDGVTVDASKQLVPTAFFWPYQGLNDREAMALRGTAIKGHVSVSSRRENSAGRSQDSRLKVGFFSAYFRNHTIGRLNIGRLEKMDRSRFHVTVCSSFRGADTFTARFEAASDRFVVVPRDVPSAIEMIESLGLDVLVFTDVGMDALSSTLAFSRMAPVQCATWGHPETTGSPAIDYFLSSELLDEESSQDHYTERLVRMPLTGTYYERPAIPARSEHVRSRLGLPEDRHLYVCPQSLFKFHPDNDDVLLRILEQDADGVLVVIEGRVEEWTARLKSRWHKTLANVIDRVVFLKALAHDDYLRLLCEADVMLDPLHFGGGNSSYEAIAMGTPIVTLPSPFLRGRITRGLFQKMNLPDCIVDSTDAFVSLAVRLGRDQPFRREVSSRIIQRSPVLFEDIEEVRCIEEALLNCVSRRP